MLPMPEVRIDTHAHVFLSDLPLAAGRRYSPQIDAPLSAYLDALDAHGLTHGVLVQPSFLGTDNSHLLTSLAAAGGRLRGIAVLDPATPGDTLDRLGAAGVLGIRLNLLGQPTPDLTSKIWRAFVARLVERDWQIEIQQHASEAIAPVTALLEAGASVVLDHFGLPDPDLGAADAVWRQLLALGATGRLWVKVSGAYRNGPDGNRVARECLPILRDTLGFQRLMWGSDWPHTQFEAVANYGRAYRLLEDLGLSPVERAEILASPARLFRCSPQPASATDEHKQRP